MAAKARSLVKVNSFGPIWLEPSSAEKRRVKLISGVAFHFLEMEIERCSFATKLKNREAVGSNPIGPIYFPKVSKIFFILLRQMSELY